MCSLCPGLPNPSLDNSEMEVKNLKNSAVNFKEYPRRYENDFQPTSIQSFPFQGSRRPLENGGTAIFKTGLRIGIRWCYVVYGTSINPFAPGSVLVFFSQFLALFRQPPRNWVLTSGTCSTPFLHFRHWSMHCYICQTYPHFRWNIPSLNQSKRERKG